jgi:hypothetical protein
MSKQSAKHKNAIQLEKPEAALPVPPADGAPAASPSRKPANGDSVHWGYSVGLVIWMAGFFGLFLQLLIEFVLGLFRK